MKLFRIYVDQELKRYVHDHPFDEDFIEVDRLWEMCQRHPTHERFGRLQRAINRVNAKNVGMALLLDAPIIVDGEWHA